MEGIWSVSMTVFLCSQRIVHLLCWRYDEGITVTVYKLYKTISWRPPSATRQDSEKKNAAEEQLNQYQIDQTITCSSPTSDFFSQIVG